MNLKNITRKLQKEPEKQSKSGKAKKGKNEQTFLEQTVSLIKTLAGAIVIVMIINGLAIASFVVPTGSMENTVMTGDFLFVNRMCYRPSTPQIIPFLNIPLPYFSFPGYSEPKRGDVIVFIYPGNRDEEKSQEFMYYLKRCVAVAGDTLEIVNNQLFINGEEVPLAEEGKLDPYAPRDPYEPLKTFPPGNNWTQDNYGPLRIPQKGDKIKLSRENLHEWKVFVEREGHKVETSAGKIYIDGALAESYIVEQDYVFGMGDNRNNSSDSRFWGFVPVKDIIGSPLIVYWSWDTGLPISRFFKKLSTIRFGRIGKIID